MSIRREVVDEILDHLPHDDPKAIRSRRDLRLINALMGNERWIARQIKKHALGQTVAELGAGRGEMCARLADGGNSVVGYDLQPRPEGLSPEVSWQEGDFFDFFEKGDYPEIMVGSLILHHFEADALSRLGKFFEACEVLVFAEPLRTAIALREGQLMLPLVNSVTRHDMIVSIRAGFLPGELPELLGLRAGWDWEEKVTLRGGLRSVGRRLKS